MQLGTDRHASDELLEQYSMGRLDANTSQAFEEHLIVCSTCQDNLAAVDLYLKSMRVAAVALRREASASLQHRPDRWFRMVFELSNPVWVVGMAVLALLVVTGSRWNFIHPSVTQPALVLLRSDRGAASLLNSSTPAARPFTLMLDLTDLPPLPQYRLEIVNATGRAVFQSGAAPENNRLRATIAKGLPVGMYYVRLYGQELLREYALETHD